MRIGPIEFYQPPLVEGPEVAFYLPLPEKWHFPWAVPIGDGVVGLPITSTIITTWIIMALLYLTFHFGMKKLQKDPSKFQAVLEMLHDAYEGLVKQVLGKNKDKYLAYISALITFILISNIVPTFPIPKFSFHEGILTIKPLLRSPTLDLNTTVGLALITVYFFISAAIKAHGFSGYMKEFVSPSPVMAPIHLLGEFAKPTNIAMRLFGNLFAGYVILGLVYLAVPWVIPVPLHMYFELFVGMVQAFVFTMLTMVYIQNSLGDEDAEHSH